MITSLHPWAIWLGVAAATLPVVVHFLTRPRPVRLPLSTIRFVRSALRQRRARHRLRDAIILGLRTLAVLLLAFAIARPLIGPRALVSPDETGRAARVVLLDVSQSLAAEHRGACLFERARSVAAGYLADSTGLRANLIQAGAAARPAFTRLTGNTAALREDLARAQVRSERLNLQAALNLAGELLAQAPADGRRELVIISDFQRSNWAGAEFAAIPQDARIQLDSVAPAEPLPNLAILRAGVPGRVEQGRDVRVEVEVGNFSPAPRRVQIEVALGDSTARAEGLCPPGVRTTLTADLPPRGTGWQAGEARLLDMQDALSADDRRPFVAEARPAPTYVLVSRQMAGQKATSSYYLERALVPLEARPGRLESKVVRLSPDQLDRDAVADADIIAFDHPGRLPAPAAQLLASLLRRGRGILYVASEAADATNLKLLADAAGSELQLPVEFEPPVARQRRRDLFLTEIRRDVPPFSVFGETLSALTGPLRFAGGLSTRRREGALADDILASYSDSMSAHRHPMAIGALADDILASYSDRSACLVVSPCGGGVLAVLNADLAACDLPGSPAFVPLIGELVGRLLGRARTAEAAACGEPLAVSLPTAAGPADGLRLVPPSGGNAEAGSLVEEGGGVMLRSPGLAMPGVYRVDRSDATVFAVAVAVPPEESDLRPLDPAVLTERLAGGRTVHFRSTAADDGEERDRFWAWLAVACAACLLAEVLALKLFRT